MAQTETTHLFCLGQEKKPASGCSDLRVGWCLRLVRSNAAFKLWISPC
jgi:hypothetical protein